MTETSVTPAVQMIAVKDYRANTGVVQASGEVTSVDQVTIKSEVNVPVRSVFVSIGQTVYAGQPLVEFEHGDVDAQLAQANAGVDQARALLNVQLAGARAEDLTRAHLAVTQAEQSLYQVIAAQDQTRIANEAAMSTLTASLTNATNNSIRTAQQVLSTTTDGLVTVATYQQTYFNCTSQSVCHKIELAKHDAMREIFAVNNGGQWNAETVLAQRGGLIARVQQLAESSHPDPIELDGVLTDLLAGLQDTRTALILTREGFELPVAFAATSTDKTTVETKRAAVDAAITTLQTQIQTLHSVQGNGFVGGDAKSLADERARAEASRRATNASIEIAQTVLASARQTLAILENGPRDVDLASLYASVRSAEAARDALSSQYRRYLITAPFNGVVASLPARMGEIIGAGQTVISLINPDLLEIVAYISDQDRALVQAGASVTIRDTHQGIVSFVAPSINPAIGKIELRITVLDPSATLTIGQTVPVVIEQTISTTDAESYRLPLPSVRIRPAGSFVLIVDDQGTIQEQQVETGVVFGARVEILSGLSVNDSILASVRGLSVGDQVTID